LAGEEFSAGAHVRERENVPAGAAKGSEA